MLPDLLATAQFFKSALYVQGLSQFDEFLPIRSDDGHCEILGRFSMKKQFSDQSILEVDILNFIWSDVLSLLQLENVFLPVDDFKE